MNGATHQNKGGVESIFVAAFVLSDYEFVTPDDNVVVNALLFALMVHAHISQNTERQLSNFRICLT
jgi:hypothetical protein